MEEKNKHLYYYYQLDIWRYTTGGREQISINSEKTQKCIATTFQTTFHYDSQYWSNYDEYNRPGGETGFDKQETKLPTYWNTSFSKICLGMKIGQQLGFIVINKQADSLHSLIADGRYRATSLGREKWKELIGSQGSLQKKCNKEGFNVVCTKKGHSKARIGIVSNGGKIVTRVTQESDLAREGALTIQTHAVTRPVFLQIMETNTSKPWDTSWYNKYGSVFAKKHL